MSDSIELNMGSKGIKISFKLYSCALTAVQYVKCSCRITRGYPARSCVSNILGVSTTSEVKTIMSDLKERGHLLRGHSTLYETFSMKKSK